MLLHVLSGTPDVLEAMLRPLGADSPRWDARPAPERFTLREITAHVADMEEVWQQRVRRTADEDEPFLANVDQDELAARNDYAHSVPPANLARFRSARAELVELLGALPDEA